MPSAGVWLFSDHFWYLVVVQFFSGHVWAAYELAVSLISVNCVRAEERTSVLTVFESGDHGGDGCRITLGRRRADRLRRDPRDLLPACRLVPLATGSIYFLPRIPARLLSAATSELSTSESPIRGLAARRGVRRRRRGQFRSQRPLLDRTGWRTLASVRLTAQFSPPLCLGRYSSAGFTGLGLAAFLPAGTFWQVSPGRQLARVRVGLVHRFLGFFALFAAPLLRRALAPCLPVQSPAQPDASPAVCGTADSPGRVPAGRARGLARTQDTSGRCDRWRPAPGSPAARKTQVPPIAPVQEQDLVDVARCVDNRRRAATKNRTAWRSFQSSRPSCEARHRIPPPSVQMKTCSSMIRGCCRTCRPARISHFKAPVSAFRL